MDSHAKKELSVQQVADHVAEKLDADVIYYNRPIFRPADQLLIEECIVRTRRKNVLLLLVTTGGDADPAYRIARCLQTKYERFYLYVSGYCKSAGTLVASGAHELVMSDHGELGPLDVQMSKKDELWEMQSGLTVMDTLTALQDNAFAAFERFFLSTKARVGGSITLKTAAQIATEMTTGLFAPLYGQVDPLHIGEAGRAMSIAGHYGRRLLIEGQNIEPAALNRIMSTYPSHGFVIDRQEASELFQNVREPTQEERLLAEKLGDNARRPDASVEIARRPFYFLSTEPTDVESQRADGQIEGDDHGKPGHAERTGPSESIKTARDQPAERDGERDTVAELNAARKVRDRRHDSA